MDLAPIVITASAIIIILQVVSIILIVRNRKTVVKPETAGVNPVNNDNRDFRKKRDDNRFNKRPVIDQRPRPFTPPQPQAVDHVEKSLRDINLKLKNAERDQENARRKIRDVIQNPQNQQDPQRRPDQNNNRPNRGRDDDFRRRDGRDRDRDRNSRPQGGHFRDRDQNRGPENIRPQGEPVAPVSMQGPAPAMPPIVEAPRPQNPVAVQPLVEKKEPLAIIPENTEVLHGRKVLVRRRILTAEEQAQAAKNGQANGTAPDSQQPSQPVVGQVTPNVPENTSQGAPSSEPAAPQAAAEPENEVQKVNFGR
jgi:hypothetical protein